MSLSAFLTLKIFLLLIVSLILLPCFLLFSLFALLGSILLLLPSANLLLLILRFSAVVRPPFPSFFSPSFFLFFVSPSFFSLPLPFFLSFFSLILAGHG